uniref:Uncharacterized protein n=1 Tax=Anguilla anguilla TaxID=7936 RepID=A0A0E9W1V2_ANGAN
MDVILKFLLVRQLLTVATLDVLYYATQEKIVFNNYCILHPQGGSISP